MSTRTLELIHNQAAGPLPKALARVHSSSIVPAAESGIQRCGRCGDDVDRHLWLLRDPGYAEQGGIVDCGRIPT